MTDTLEKLAEELSQHFHAPHGQLLSAAAAILAALPDMVEPLVWEGGRGPRFEQTSCGAYEIYYTGDAGRTLLKFGAGCANAFFTWQFSSDALGEKAKAAANAHHRTTILAALGVN